MRTTSQEPIHNKQQVEAAVFHVQQGETEQYAVIIQAYQQPLFRYCSRLLGNKQDAEDAVQEILIRVYQAIDRYQPEVSFSAWVYRIAYHYCLNLLRKQRLHQKFMRLFRPKSVTPGPEQVMDDQLFHYPLSAAIAQLTVEERNLLVLRVFEQMTFVEISEILGVHSNALHKRMERMKQKMKKTLEQKEEQACSELGKSMTTRC